MRFAVTSSASSSGMPSCSSVTTRLNSRFDGSGASSATTPIAPARLCPARSADASTSRFSGSCSPKSFRTLPRLAADVEVERDRRDDAEDDPERAEQHARDHGRAASPAKTDSQTILLGSCSICATSTSSEKPSIQRQLRFRCFCWPTASEQRVDLLAPLGRALLRRQRDEVAEARDERLVGAKAPERRGS